LLYNLQVAKSKRKVDVLHFASLSRDSNEFEEQKILTASGHPVSALCVLPPSDGETLGLIAIASSNDHIIRIYRTDETNPLYQLQGHTDTGFVLVLLQLQPSYHLCSTNIS